MITLFIFLNILGWMILVSGGTLGVLVLIAILRDVLGGEVSEDCEGH